MADTINRRCGCKGSPEGVWVVNCGASAVTPGNCVSTSDCKGTCDNTGKFKPNKGTDLEHNKEITMDPKVPTPRGPGEIKPKDTASGTLMESKMKKLIKRTLLNEGPYCNGAGQDPATHTPCHRRGLGCLNMDEGYFGEMGQCVTCNPEWACVRIVASSSLIPRSLPFSLPCLIILSKLGFSSLSLITLLIKLTNSDSLNSIDVLLSDVSTIRPPPLVQLSSHSAND